MLGSYVDNTGVDVDVDVDVGVDEWDFSFFDWAIRGCPC